MRYLKQFYLVLLFATLVVSGASAEIAVQIVDIPQTTFVYSPTYVIFTVENKGTEPALLPFAENAISMSIELGKPNEHLEPIGNPSQGTSLTDPTSWLRAGEKRYFYFDIGPYLDSEGLYELRAGLQGSGECRMLQKQPQPYPVKRLRLIGGMEDYPTAIFECWSGDVRSEIVKISVSKRASAVDDQVLRLVINPLRYTRSAFSEAYPYLKDHFSNSYYTFVAGMYRAEIYGGGDPLEILAQIMHLQPNNPLQQQARILWAIRVIEESHSPYRDDRDKLPKLNPAQLDLPSPVQEALKQFNELKDQEADAVANKGR